MPANDMYIASNEKFTATIHFAFLIETHTHPVGKTVTSSVTTSSIITSGTSNARPLTKYFKFSGRGQRDTPVISGQGLVRC